MNCECGIPVNFPVSCGNIDLNYCGVEIPVSNVVFVNELPQIGDKDQLYVCDMSIYRWDNDELKFICVAGEELIDEKGRLLIEAITKVIEQLDNKIPTNLENGEGTDSLVQKYSGAVDSTHYGNSNTGESAVVFGEANKNAANRSLLYGKLNDNSGANSLVGGSNNINDQTGVSLSGYNNFNKGSNSTIGGRGNKNYSEASAVTGSGNTNGVESNTSESYGSSVSGAGNTNTAKYASISGSTNTNDGSSATVSGQNNNNTGGRAIVGGMGNTNSGHDTIVVGKGLKNRHENLSVFGKYNDNKSVNLLEIGNGKDAEHPSNAFEVLRDGRAKSYGAPVEGNDVVRKFELDKKFDKAGGIISGNVFVQGNLTISGETTTLNTVTLQVKDNVIVANADGAELVENAGFAMKTSANDAYGIMYDPVDDGVKIGIGVINENGEFNYAKGEDQFLATRADTIVNGHTVVWDDENKTLIDSGVDHSELVKFTDYASQNTAGVVKVFAGNHGLNVTNGILIILPASNAEIEGETNIYKAITAGNYKHAVKVGLTTNTEMLTDEDKASACEWLGALKKETVATTNPRIYGKKPNGGQAMFNVVQNTYTANTIPQRTATGTIHTATPMYGNEAANKGYVDETCVAKQANTGSMNVVYGEEHSGKGSKMFTLASGGTGDMTIPMRNANGQFDVRAPQSDLNVANKQYVDTNFVAKTTDAVKIYGTDADGNQTTYNYINARNDGNTVAGRDVNGNIQVGTARYPSDATSKSYVENNFVAKFDGSQETGDLRFTVYGQSLGTPMNRPISSIPKEGALALYSSGDSLQTGLVRNDNDCTTKKYVDDFFAFTMDFITTADLWKPVHKEYTTILDTDGRKWDCDAVGYYNNRTSKYKVEYTLISTQEITANADNVAISVPLIGVNYTLGAKYRAATIAYSALPNIEQNEDMGNDTFKQSYFTLDGFTWDEQTDIGNECTPLPFRGSGGFEVKVLTWTEDPVASITFKTIIAKVTKYEV